MSPPPAPPTSSSIIANNDDILTQLLVCLPNKSLHRFRCVSKQWCSLISGNYFIQRRSSRKYRHRSINGLFLHTQLDDRCSSSVNTWKFDFISIDANVRGNAISSTTLSFTNDIGGIQIKQSCNGLLLCSTFQIYNFDTRRFDSSAKRYYIYNPTTKQYNILPRVVDRKYNYGLYFSVSLAFNPIKSPHYKVICMLRNAKEDYEIHIYSSETCSLKVVAHSHAFPYIWGSGVFWNGLLCWHNGGSSFVYFDTEREIFSEEKMPSSFCFLLLSIRTSLYFGECKGRLYYIELDLNPDISIFERHCSNGWRLIYNIPMQRLRELFFKKIGDCFLQKDVKVLLIDVQETEEEYESPKLVLQIRNKVFSCDLESVKKNLDTEPSELFVQGDSGHGKVIHAYQYIKSFAHV